MYALSKVGVGDQMEVTLMFDWTGAYRMNTADEALMKMLNPWKWVFKIKDTLEKIGDDGSQSRKRSFISSWEVRINLMSSCRQSLTLLERDDASDLHNDEPSAANGEE